MEKRLLAVEGREVLFSHDRKGKLKTLNGLDISVPKGVVYGLLGPSGCGKTTLLRCIVGRLKPKTGSIRVYGRVPGETGFCIPGRGVGYMPQELALYLDISIDETLVFFGRLFRMDYSEITERICFLTKLLRIPDKCSLIKNLSGGQKRRVSFAAALIHKPPLLILDEPTVGVDPLLRQNIWEHLQTLTATDHSTIIITTHYVEEARLAHVVGFMREGQLLAEDEPEKLMEQFQTRTLEEVFLKLCQKEFEPTTEPSPFVPLMSALDKIANGCDSDVWVGHEEQQNHPTKGNGHHEISVSDGEQDNTHLKVMYRQSNVWQLCHEGLDRLGTLVRKSFIRMKRNWPLTLFHLLVPAAQILLFCLFIGQNPYDLKLAIVNLETAPFSFSQKFLNKIDTKTIIQKPYSNLSLALESVKTRETWGVLFIGRDFSMASMDRFLEGSNVEPETIENSAIKLFLDMTNQQISTTVHMAVNRGFQEFALSILQSTGHDPRLADPPIILGEPVYGEIDTNFTEFMAAGMMLGVTNFMAMGLTALSIVLEKREGLLDRSWVAGVNSAEVIFSIIISMITTMVLQVILVLVIVLAVFAIPVRGSIVWAFFCVFLSGANGMATGLFISSICNSENEAVMLVLACFSPSFMLCGIMWPVEAMGNYLRYFSYSLPLTLLAETMRSVLSRGWTITHNQIWDGPLVCFTWTAALTLISVIMFKVRN